jgi:hypothetical protein
VRAQTAIEAAESKFVARGYSVPEIVRTIAPGFDLINGNGKVVDTVCANILSTAITPISMILPFFTALIAHEYLYGFSYSLLHPFTFNPLSGVISFVPLSISDCCSLRGKTCQSIAAVVAAKAYSCPHPTHRTGFSCGATTTEQRKSFITPGVGAVIENRCPHFGQVKGNLLSLIDSPESY